jgi:hypothetical protein
MNVDTKEMDIDTKSKAINGKEMTYAQMQTPLTQKN